MEKKKIRYKYFRKTEIAIFALVFLLPIILINYQSVKGAFVSSSEPIEESYSVVIKDEERIIYGRTTSRNERESLDQNNISHWPEDVISSELILDPVRYQGAGRLIEIKRAPVYYIKVDRKSIEVRDWDGEVEKIIEKGKVILNPNDVVNYDLSSKLTNGAEINITRINYAEVTETETIDFNTIIQNDYYVQAGRSAVVQKGSKGSMEVKYSVTYKDGEEVSRTKLNSSRISDPRNEIIKKGLMPSNRPYFNRSYWDMMVAAGLKYGVSPVDLFTVAACESRVN
ncbi:G5 domain-containing protein, partial [Patescibacteria group bacterium]|nr:G5 domain-containing protein [Patescibacteria group bacterium]